MPNTPSSSLMDETTASSCVAVSSTNVTDADRTSMPPCVETAVSTLSPATRSTCIDQSPAEPAAPVASAALRPALYRLTEEPDGALPSMVCVVEVNVDGTVVMTVPLGL